MRVTNLYLAHAYASFNKKYFRNRLPKDMAIRFGKIEECGSAQFKFQRPLFIILNKRLAWHYMLVDMTLLHEMVHVEHPEWGGHGVKFQKRMLKLAKEGAFRCRW